MFKRDRAQRVNGLSRTLMVTVPAGSRRVQTINATDGTFTGDQRPVHEADATSRSLVGRASTAATF